MPPLVVAQAFRPGAWQASADGSPKGLRYVFRKAALPR